MTIIRNVSSHPAAQLKLRVVQLQPPLPQQLLRVECQLCIYVVIAPWLREEVVVELKAYVVPRLPTALIAWCSSALPVLTQIHILKTNIICELQWGQYLRYSFSKSAAVVSNQAIAGRSARSFTREGRFDTVANLVQSGDWVVIEFGHNDGGSLTPTDNGRTACFGDGTQTCSTVYK